MGPKSSPSPYIIDLEMLSDVGDIRKPTVQSYGTPVYKWPIAHRRCQLYGADCFRLDLFAMSAIFASSVLPPVNFAEVHCDRDNPKHARYFYAAGDFWFYELSDPYVHVSL